MRASVDFVVYGTGSLELLLYAVRELRVGLSQQTMGSFAGHCGEGTTVLMGLAQAMLCSSEKGKRKYTVTHYRKNTVGIIHKLNICTNLKNEMI